MEWYSSTPRRVTGGIAVRNQRGPIGQQWWSRRFLQVLESFGLTSRLARGRNYARRGQVVSLDVGHGAVRADVQGSAYDPYSVQITVPKLSEAQWSQVESALAGAALFRAALLAGELPPEIEEVFAACGAPLFPRTEREIAMSCDCPDYSVPCKHLAAVCYVLADKFDDDPFLVLAWRGRDRDELTARIRRLAAPEPAAPEPAAVGRAWATGLADRPLAECLENFWDAGPLPATAPPDADAPTDGLLRALAPPPVTVRRKRLVDVLAPAYATLAPAYATLAPAYATLAPADATLATAGESDREGSTR